MILYLDTSAFIRLYVREHGREQVWSAVREASLTVTHLIAYAEMRAALARICRMRRLSDREFATIKGAFEVDWNNCLQIAPTESLMRRAGELAESHSLRGYDSVHLAAAESLESHGGDVVFACFDQDLNLAARALGLRALVSASRSRSVSAPVLFSPPHPPPLPPGERARKGSFSACPG